MGVAGLSSSTKSPSACERWTMSPGWARSTSQRDTDWPGRASPCARTVSVMVSPGSEAAEEIVKQRVVRRLPGRSTPTWTYCPAR